MSIRTKRALLCVATATIASCAQAESFDLRADRAPLSEGAPKSDSIDASTQAAIDALCTAVAAPSNAATAIAYTDLAKSLDIPAKLTTLFTTTFQKHGACTRAAVVTVSAKNARDLTFSLDLADGLKPIFRTRFDAVGALDTILFKGTLPAQGAVTVSSQRVAMRDGVELATITYRDPNAGPGACPVVLTRTPYLYVDDQLDLVTLINTAKYFVDRGYVFVWQGVRGTPGSGGEFRIFNPVEVDDAFDTLDWLARQPFCNGRIAVTGTSYDGFTSLAAAVTNHPALKVVFAGGAPVSLGDEAFRIQGLIRFGLLDYLRYNHRGGPKVDLDALSAASKKLLEEPDATRYDETLYGESIPEWDAIARAADDPAAPIWTDRSIEARLASIAVPTYHVAGTGADGDAQDVLRNFRTLERSSHHPEVHHLIVGPWDHASSTVYGNGVSVTASPFIAQRIVPIFDHFLKDMATPFAREPRVQLVRADGETVIGMDSLGTSPLATQTAFFRAGGLATLDPPRSGEAASKGYDYLPRAHAELGGPQVASFTYSAEAHEEIVGDFSAELYVRSDRPETDVFLQIVKTTATGAASNVGDMCFLGARIFDGPGVSRVSARDCPIQTMLDKGDMLTFYVTSNLFPAALRVAERDANGAYVFHDGHVEVLHSAETPSKVSWRLAPARPPAEASDHRFTGAERCP
jgi:predicted acyl esterase